MGFVSGNVGMGGRGSWGRIWIAVAGAWCVMATAWGAEPGAEQSVEPPAQWIWGAGGISSNTGQTVAEPEACHFQRKFALSDVASINSAELQIACDDRYVLRINDRLIGIGHQWQQIDRYDVAAALRDGENVIHVVAGNDQGPAGLLVKLIVRGAAGECELVSDGSWQAAVQKAGTWDPRAGLTHDWRPVVAFGPFPTTEPWGGQPQLADQLRGVRRLSGDDIARSLELKDGDRVVLLGATMIEREPQSGYWESRLTSQFPGRRIVFRNLGWSGDTVTGVARARFGTAADGFRDLEVQTHSLEPTVIFVAYGANESFAGQAGLDAFVADLDRLLLALAPTGAQIVLVSPIQHENLGQPLPEPGTANADRQIYRDAIRRVAERDGLRYVDLAQPQESIDSPGHHWTDNGIHLSPYGYFRTGAMLAEQLGLQPLDWKLDIDAAVGAYDAGGASVQAAKFEPNRVELVLTSQRLPYAPSADSIAPTDGSAAADGLGGQRVRIHGLPEGDYELTIDGVRQRVASAAEWGAGVALPSGPDFEQAEELRRLIVRKNELFFHRWRPQNETYLFLFRKHEQGNNAVEIPQFDPLIRAAEEEIATLSQPRSHRWIWQPVER